MAKNNLGKYLDPIKDAKNDFHDIEIGHCSKRTFFVQYRASNTETIWKESKASYVYRIGEDIAFGLTQYRADGKLSKKWLVTILPEGLLWRTFDKKRDAMDFIALNQKDLMDYVGKVRETRKELLKRYGE